MPQRYNNLPKLFKRLLKKKQKGSKNKKIHHTSGQLRAHPQIKNSPGFAAQGELKPIIF